MDQLSLDVARRDVTENGGREDVIDSNGYKLEAPKPRVRETRE